MSLTQRTTTVRLRFRDNDSAEATCDVNLRTTVSIDDAITFLASWHPIVQAISSATIISADVIVRWHDPSPGTPDLASDDNFQGTFIFDTASSDQATIRIPSFDPSFLETTGPFAFIRIDQTITAVLDLITTIVDGLSSVEPCDPFASDLTAINVAYVEQF